MGLIAGRTLNVLLGGDEEGFAGGGEEVGELVGVEGDFDFALGVGGDFVGLVGEDYCVVVGEVEVAAFGEGGDGGGAEGGFVGFALILRCGGTFPLGGRLGNLEVLSYGESEWS